MKNSKKMLVISILGFLLFSLKAWAAQPDDSRFCFKLTGGMNYLLVGDTNEYIEGKNNSLKTYTKLYGYFLEGEFKKIQLGLDFEGELTIALSSRFGISIGSGYILGVRGKDSNKMVGNFPTDESIYTLDVKISAIPIKLGVYYYFPLTSQACFSINAGAGYYFAKWSLVFHGEWKTDWNTRDDQADGKGIGFHGGIGFEFYITHNVALVLEGQGRFAKIDGFEGVSNTIRAGGVDPTSGKLYYYESLHLGTGQWYPMVRIWDEKPTWERNVREANVDFSGFAIRAGMKISF